MPREVQAELQRVMFEEQRVRARLGHVEREVRAGMRDVDGVMTRTGQRAVAFHHRRRLGEHAHRGLDRGLQRLGARVRQWHHRELQVLVRVAAVVMAMAMVVSVVVFVVVMTVLAVHVHVVVRMGIVFTARAQ
jgi:hypothetical protein